jgi:beta-1,4-mannosyl-glycoprotein beta-1,4-N-acetylglucosaminyltransferase
MTWDCFTFYNEFELLRLRCEELRPLGVRHVLVEATKTHSGLPKRLHFNERKAEFDDCNIMHIVVKDMPLGWTYQDHWHREKFQRNALLKAPFSAEDTVLIGDCDEIPRASAIKGWDGDMAHLIMDSFRYWLNHPRGKQDWSRARICRGRWIVGRMPSDVRLENEGQRISNAGWHFSWLCGNDPSKITKKMEALAHQELNMIGAAEQYPINEGPFTPMDTWPKYLVNNEGQFANLIHSFPTVQPQVRLPMRIHLKCKCGDEIEVEDIHMASVQDEARRWKESHMACEIKSVADGNGGWPKEAPRNIAAELAMDSAHIPLIENIIKKHLEPTDPKRSES